MGAPLLHAYAEIARFDCDLKNVENEYQLPSVYSWKIFFCSFWLQVINEHGLPASKRMTSSSSESHHYAPGPSNTRKPFLRFPPPPPYPPGPSSSSEYAYAYYEPGMPGPGSGRNSRKHSYITRYGTEENIYEEISPTRLEEEVRYVHSRHLQVLDELNLTVEAMLMPQPSAVAALNQEAAPAEDLSPASCSLDSGFSGSSSGTNSLGRSYTPKKKQPQRFWKKLPGLGSTTNCSKLPAAGKNFAFHFYVHYKCSRN